MVQTIEESIEEGAIQTVYEKIANCALQVLKSDTME